MADYINIPNEAIDGDSPPTQTIFEALRDNPVAIAEGAIGAPRFKLGSIDTDAVTNDKIQDYTIQTSKFI